MQARKPMADKLFAVFRRMTHFMPDVVLIVYLELGPRYTTVAEDSFVLFILKKSQLHLEC